LSASTPPGPLSFSSARRICATVDESSSSAKRRRSSQIGSAFGYAPLRPIPFGRARATASRPDEDILITNACQQAFDIIQRVLPRTAETVLLEDHVYAGLRNVFRRAARAYWESLREAGSDFRPTLRCLEEPTLALLVVTPRSRIDRATMPRRTPRGDSFAGRQAGVLVNRERSYARSVLGGSRSVTRRSPASRSSLRIRSCSGQLFDDAFPGLRVGGRGFIGQLHLSPRVAEAIAVERSAYR